MNVPSSTEMKIELVLDSCPRRVHVLQQKILKLKFFKKFLRETEMRWCVSSRNDVCVVCRWNHGDFFLNLIFG